MIVGLIATLVTVLGLVAQVGGTKLIHRADYQRCLSNITRLEAELGINGTTPEANAIAWTYVLNGTDAEVRDVRARQIAEERCLPYVRPPTASPPTKAEIAAQRKESVRVAKYAMARNRQ